MREEGVCVKVSKRVILKKENGEVRYIRRK
jgi:hypothetical protein